MANKPLNAPPDGFEDAPPDGFETIVKNAEPVTRTALAFAPGEDSFAQSPIIDAARREGPTSVTMTIPQTMAVAETDAPITHIIKASVDPHQEIASGALKPGDVFYQQGVGKFKVGQPTAVTRNLDQTASDMPDAPPDGFVDGQPPSTYPGSDAWGNTPVVQGKPFLQTPAGKFLVTRPEEAAQSLGADLTEAMRTGTLHPDAEHPDSSAREKAIFDEAQKTGQVPYGKIFSEMAGYVPAKLLSGFAQSWMTPTGIATNVFVPKVVEGLAQEVPALAAPISELWHDYVTGKKITKTVTVAQLSDFFRTAADSGRLSPDQMTQMGDAISNLTKTASGVDVTARVPRFGEGAPEIRSVTPSGEPLPEPLPPSRQINAPAPVEMPRPTPGPDLSSLPPEIRALVQDRGAPIPPPSSLDESAPSGYPISNGQAPIPPMAPVADAGMVPEVSGSPGPGNPALQRPGEPGSYPISGVPQPYVPGSASLPISPPVGTVQGALPDGTTEPTPAKVRKPTRREVEAYARGLHEEATQSRSDNFTRLEQFFMSHPISPSSDTMGEYNADIPVRFKKKENIQHPLAGGRPLDKRAQEAQMEGIIPAGEDADVYARRFLADIKKRGNASPVSAYMDQARRELEHEYEVYGPPKKTRMTGDVEPAPFEKGPDYGLQTGSPGNAKAKLDDILNRAGWRMALESQGQNILDDLENHGISVHTVEDDFFRNRYPKLPEQGKMFFRRYINKMTGYDDEKIKNIISSGTWGPELDLAVEPHYLEGIERGFVTLMQETRRRMDAGEGPQESSALPPPRALLGEKQPGLFGGNEPVTGKPAKPGTPGQMSLFGQKAQPKFEPPASAFKTPPAPTGPEPKQTDLVAVSDYHKPGPQAQRLALTGEGKEQVPLQVPRALIESVVVKDLAEQGFLPVHKMRIESPTDTAAIFNFLKNKTVENFYTLALDAQDKIVGAQLISVGSIDQTVAAPMDALRGAHLLGAKRVVFVHNHPSLRADPSREDVALTRVLDAAAKSIGIEVSHHVVIDGDTEYGLIDPNDPRAPFAAQTLPLDSANAPEARLPAPKGGVGATETPRNEGKPFSVPLVEPLRVGGAIGTKITNPESAVAYVKTIRDRPKGVMLLGLDTRGYPASAWFMGSHYQKPDIMASDIGKIAMRNNASRVILVGDRLPEEGYVKALQKQMNQTWRIEIMDMVAPGTGTYPESAHVNGWIVKEEGPIYEGVRENGKLALPPLQYVDDKALSFQPLDITSKKGLKATGADIRTEYAGSVNAQKAVVAHLAQDIRKMVPSLVERQGLTIGRDAGWDENVLRDALQSEKPQLVAARPAIKAALAPTPAMLKAGELMTKYYGETGLVGRTHGFLSSLVDDERYINRIYKEEPPDTRPKTEAGRSGLSRSTSHAKARFYDTILDAMNHGKIPATLDAADLLTIHGAEFARTLNNNKLYEALARENVGYKMKNADEKIPSDWTRLGNSNFVVPKWFEVGIRAITDPNFMNRVEGMKEVQVYQGLVKTIDLSLSAFHHFTMVMQLLYQNKYGLGIPSLVKFMANADYRKVELDFLKHGGTTHTIDANMEVLRKLADGNDWMSRFLKMPGMKQYIGLIDANNRFLFGKMQPWFKVMDYGKKVSAWAQSHPKATAAEAVTARRSLAKEVNATYGGLNWKALGVTPTGLSIGRLLFLAPDWTYSNIELLKTAASKGAGGAAARGHILSALIGGLILTEGLNHILTGHSSSKNAKGHQFEIEVRPGVYVSLFRGAIGDALKWANMMHENGLIVGSARFVQGKTAPLVRTGLGLMSNTNYIGRKIVKKRGTMMSKTGDALKFIAGSAGPVPFGVSAISQAGSMDPISDILILSGLARPGRPGQTEQKPGPTHIQRGPKK